MLRRRILLFGASGQVGQALHHLSAQEGFPAYWDLLCYGREQADITEPSKLRDIVQELRPHLIINASGITNIDEAEKNRAAATAINFYTVAQMAAQCSVLDIPLIHLSTDYVFDGTKNTPYLTTDQMNPLNHYADSKMMGEEAIRQELAWHVILRTSSVFSAFRRNIMTKALSSLEQHPELRVVTDLVSTPTYALDLAEAIIAIASELLMGKTDGFGTFHYTGAPVASRFDFVDALIHAYNDMTGQHATVVPTVCAEFTGYAPRPAYSALECSRIKDIYGIRQKPWQDGLIPALEMLAKTGRLHFSKKLTFLS